MKTLNELRDAAYQNAVEHGWHEEDQPDTHWIMLIVSELAEAIQADRSNRKANKSIYLASVKSFEKEDIYKDIMPSIKLYYYQEIITNTIEDELADVIIRILDFAGLRKIDLETIKIPSEEKYNENLLETLNLPLPQFCFIITQQLTSDIFEPEDLQCAIFLVKEYARLKLQIDLNWFIEMKMEYNKHRRYKHGKKY